MIDEEFKCLLNINPGWVDLTRPIHINITHPAILSCEQFSQLSEHLSRLSDQYIRSISLRKIDYDEKTQSWFLLKNYVGCILNFV